MKNNNHKFFKNLLATLFILTCLTVTAQDIEFSFSNAQNTNDGANG